MKFKKKEKAPSPSPSSVRSVLLPKSASRPMESLRRSGRLGDDPPITFSLILPRLPNEEDRLFLEQVADRFLSFLEKESKGKRSAGFLGLMDWSLESRRLSILAFYGPFEARQLTSVAVFDLDEGGTLTLSRKTKKKPEKKLVQRGRPNRKRPKSSKSSLRKE